MAIAIKGRADFPSQAAAPPALPKGEPSCAMTNLGTCRIRRGALANLQAPPSRVIARSEASLALPLGELSPKVTERALQALLNGNSNQGEGCFSLSGGCAASSPKGRAKDTSLLAMTREGGTAKLVPAPLRMRLASKFVIAQLGSPFGRAGGAAA